MAVGSFSAGLSGLNANGAYLSVIGNNLANINTVGFKASSVTFSDLVSQTVGGSSVNPMQVGLGVTTGSISPVFSQGAIENTREATNVAIQGNGFFVVRGSGGNCVHPRRQLLAGQRRQADDARRPVRPGLHGRERHHRRDRHDRHADGHHDSRRRAPAADGHVVDPDEVQPRRRRPRSAPRTRPPCSSTIRSASRTSRRSPIRRRRPAAGATRSPCRARRQRAPQAPPRARCGSVPSARSRSTAWAR